MGDIVDIQVALRLVLIVWPKNVRRKNKKWALLCLLAGAPFLASFSQQDDSLSEKERFELESYFRLLFKRSEFGYALFGDKPMSFFSYAVKPPPDFLIFANFSDPKIEKYYLIYEKYKDKLFSQNYVILDQLCVSNKFPTSGIVRDVLIINKKAFAVTVKEHLSLFRERLGERASPESLLADIESGKNVFFDVLKEDELLWGILLGYGRHNAEVYARRETIMDGRATFPSPGYSNLVEELDAIDDLLVGFSYENFVELIPLPGFLCDENDKETHLLKANYKKNQAHICEIYNSPNFLDLVLKQLKLSMQD